MDTHNLFGGIEGGGTKFVCAVGTGPQDIRAEARFATTSPAETLERAVHFFRGYEADLAAVGVACFGPLDPHPDSASYGHILPTPKPGWTGADIVGTLREALRIPIAFDTDVNGAALGEFRWGAAQGLDTFIYLTVGTGIGGGAFVNGKLLHGLIHPEMGHVFLRRDKQKDPFAGICPFHGDCFEGLASGVAIEKRWGASGEALPESHPAWDLEADYIAQALADYSLTLSPQRIILGGGVGSLPRLLPKVRARTREWLHGYIRSPVILEGIESYIVPPGLGHRSGMLGAIALAGQAWEDGLP